jgi:hypothetical protein
LPLLPAVQASVRDACTGRPVSGLVVSISDAAGAVSVPSKVSTGGFQFASVSGSGLVLQVSAPAMCR